MDESTSLRRETRHLVRTLKDAIRAFKGLTPGHRELAWIFYREHGCPFGATDEAASIWIEYQQYTTGN